MKKKYIQMYIQRIYMPTCIARATKITKPRMSRKSVLVVEDNILFPLLTLPFLFMLISFVRKKKRYLTIDNKVFSRNTFVPSLTVPSFSLF